MRRNSSLILGFVYLVLTAQVFAQVSYYPMTVDQDRLSGAPDFGFLNHPLTAADQLFVRDGHFYRVGEDRAPNTADDERVRLFGVNLAFSANYPFGDDATRVAKRLRRLGVNLVRLHLMDVNAGADKNLLGSLLADGAFPTFDSFEVTRLRNLLGALRNEGIYVDLNLHVAYEFRPQLDNVPAIPGCQAMSPQSKPLHSFYPRMVELQKQYARALIDRLQLATDPVLGLLEIDNESSLLEAWQTSNLDRWVQGEYRAELQRQWNAFLRAKYASTEELRAAWGGSDERGNELLALSGLTEGSVKGWHFTASGSARGQAEVLSLDETPTLKAQVFSAAPGVQAIFQQDGFALRRGQQYAAEVEISADLPDGQCRDAVWAIQKEGEDYRPAVWHTIRLTNQWQRHTLAFNPDFDFSVPGRFGLMLENVQGVPVYVRKWSLRPAAPQGLAQNETLEAESVSLVGEQDNVTDARKNDYLRFLAQTQQNFLRELRSSLQSQIGTLTPITGTQMSYGGMLNWDSHAEMDFIDTHFYIDYPSYPRGDNGVDWFIYNRTGSAFGFPSMRNAALMREAGRPFTISEFNQGWPNQYGAEIDPTTAVFAAFQGWDSIMHFAYSHGRNFDLNIPNAFNLDGDVTKLVNIGQSAWLFRSGVIEEGRAPITIPVSEALRLQAGREKRNGEFRSFLEGMLGFKSNQAFIHPVQVVRDDQSTLSDAAQQEPSAPYTADTGQMAYDPNGKVFLVQAEQAAGVFGFAGQGKVVQAGAISVELSNRTRGFTSTLLTALDQQPLTKSKRMLLSSPGYALRSQPGSNNVQEVVPYDDQGRYTLAAGPRNPNGTPNDPHGNIYHGVGPVWMEQVESWLTLRTEATSITIYPLDGTGARQTALAAQFIEKVSEGYRIHLQASGQPLSPWYEITTDDTPVVTYPAAHVVAGGYQGPDIAPESIVAAFGQGLATETVGAPSLPLPTSLAGTSVKVKDAAGIERLAPLFWVTNDQVRYQMPAGTALGQAHITITSGTGKVFVSAVPISTVAPGVFTANDSGQGFASGYVIRTTANGQTFVQSIAYMDANQGWQVVAVPIDFGEETDTVDLCLLATGVRFRSSMATVSVRVGTIQAEVISVVPDQRLPGRDVIKARLPRSLQGRSVRDVLVAIDGRAANTVQILTK